VESKKRVDIVNFLFQWYGEAEYITPCSDGRESVIRIYIISPTFKPIPRECDIYRRSLFEILPYLHIPSLSCSSHASCFLVYGGSGSECVELALLSTAFATAIFFSFLPPFINSISCCLPTMTSGPIVPECLCALRRRRSIKAMIKIIKLTPMETPTPVPTATVCSCEVETVAAPVPPVGSGEGGGVAQGCPVTEGRIEVRNVEGEAPELVGEAAPPLQYPAFGSFVRSSLVKVM